MYSTLDITSALLLAAVLNCILLVINEFNQPRSRRSVWVLISYLSLIFILVEHIVDFSGYLVQWPHFQFISTPLFFLYTPALYLSLEDQASVKPHKKWWLHLIVPVIVLVIMIPTYVLSGEVKAIRNLDTEAKDPVIFIVCFFVHFFFYAWKISRHLLKGRAGLLKNFANPSVEKERRAMLMMAFLLLFTFSFPLLMIFQYISTKMYLTLERPLVFLFSMNAHIALYVAMMKDRNSEFIVEDKLESVAMNPMEMDRLKTELVARLVEHKDYLKPDLTLKHLSGLIGTNRSTLSAVINQGLNTNFYQLINTHRISEAKKRMASPDAKTYSLDYLAQQCGFTNYVSFYRVFKRIEGITPSEYLKVHN